MDIKQSFLHVSINFPPLQLQSLSFSHITIFLAVIHPLIIIHDTFFAVFLPCSYTPLNYHSEQSPLQLYIIYLIYTILYFTIYYSITITQYFLLVYIHNPIILYPILYIFLSYISFYSFSIIILLYFLSFL